MTLCPLCQSPMLNYRCLTTIINHWGIKNNHFVIDSNAELIFTISVAKEAPTLQGGEELAS